MSQSKTILALCFLICLTVHAFGQHHDDRIAEVINSKNDTLCKGVADYSLYALKYRECISALKKMNGQADSLRNNIRTSSLTVEEQTLAMDLIKRAANDTPADVALKIKDTDPAFISSVSKYLSLTFIDELDRKYHGRLLTIEKIRQWAAKMSTFIHHTSIDYFNAAKIKLPDTVFLREVKTYRFRKDDVIADIGAGSGYFERVLSRYCDHLTVYANDINTFASAQLETKLKLLEHYDRKEITYHNVTGNETSSLLPADHFDKVIIRNTYHHFSSADEMMKDCRRILKKGGTLYIVDILIDETTAEPECKLHLTRKDFLKVINENGFRLINETPLDYDHFKCFEFQLM